MPRHILQEGAAIFGHASTQVAVRLDISFGITTGMFGDASTHVPGWFDR